MKRRPDFASRSWKEFVASHSRPIVSLAVLVACLFATALLGAAPASAESRGFVLTNESSATLRLESATHVHRTVCSHNGVCQSHVAYEMAWEGRPHDGSEIAPGGSHRWDLKYKFDFFDLTGTHYAAQLTYKIEHTNAKVVYTIATTTTSNNSSCKVIPADAGTCTAGGLDLTFSN